ncbi:hypothetical protein LIER_13578 [Lithospermum erythrorhizon]|uniref:Uncharacterized protein n=1 Tax=Lithospermum erythrorhizon TaxID=34254 RepID=A0AAV3Q0I6_LITER
MWQSEESHNVLSNLSSTLGKNARRGRENHPKVMSTRGETQKENDNSPKEREKLKRPVPHEEIVKVSFEKEEPERTFQVGTMLKKNHKEGLICLIRDYKLRCIGCTWTLCTSPLSKRNERLMMRITKRLE